MDMRIEYVFANIEERDTDLAIIKSFVDYKSVRDKVFDVINRHGDIVKIYHSLTQKECDGNYGESDIVIICKDDKGLFAVFIEDKINAIPQPRQRSRYDDRALNLMQSEHFDDYYVLLCAPKAYLDTAKADGYTFILAHEDIKELLKDDDMNKSIFCYSCEKKQTA